MREGARGGRHVPSSQLSLETAVGSTDYSDSTDWKPVERGCRFTPRVIWKQRRGEASSPGPSVKSVKSVDSPTAAFRLSGGASPGRIPTLPPIQDRNGAATSPSPWERQRGRCRSESKGGTGRQRPRRPGKGNGDVAAPNRKEERGGDVPVALGKATRTLSLRLAGADPDSGELETGNFRRGC